MKELVYFGVLMCVVFPVGPTSVNRSDRRGQTMWLKTTVKVIKMNVFPGVLPRLGLPSPTSDHKPGGVAHSHVFGDQATYLTLLGSVQNGDMEPSCKMWRRWGSGSLPVSCRHVMNSLRRKLALGTWSITLLTGKELELVCEMKKCGPDIVGLACAHRKRSSKLASRGGLGSLKGCYLVGFP